MFDSIATLAVASNMRELYRLVLVDTPLAPYFSESLSAGLLLPQHFPLPLTFGHGLHNSLLLPQRMHLIVLFWCHLFALAPLQQV
jgi:hypothetical protein